MLGGVPRRLACGWLATAWIAGCATPAASPSATRRPPAPFVESAPGSPTTASNEIAPPPRVATLEPSPPPRHSTRVERLDVPGDKWALVSRGAPGSREVLVYLHGKCGDPDAFRAFLEAVPTHFTVLSLRGEIKCKDGARTRWAGHVPSLDQRIARAVEAASAGLAVPLRRDRVVVFGYSQGSLRAEALVQKLPERYPAAILAAGPRAPKPHALDRAGAVVLLAGQQDARGHLMKAAEEMAAKGLPVRYQELPDAHHGEYGPKAATTVASCFSWIEERVSFTDEGHSLQK